MTVGRGDEDFISQMRLLVAEQGDLFEFPLASRDLLPGGTVRHGPWDPAECAEVLGAWFAKGWRTLFVDAGHAEPLGEPARWSRTSVDGDPRFR